MSGGKHGFIVSTSDPEESEIIKRIHLPREEKKHMPPKAKPQLSKAEINLIVQWISYGAPEKSSISELGLSPRLFSSFFPKDETGIYPEPLLKPLSRVHMDSLISKGLLVAPIYKNSSLLKISAINSPDFGDQDAELLLKAMEHIVDLDIGQTQVTDSIFEILQQLKNLTVLKLNKTFISGSEIKKLTTLKYLKQINLVHSNFEANYLKDLYSFPALEKVYLFGTPLNTSDIEIPEPYHSIFEKGNYKLDEELEETL